MRKNRWTQLGSLILAALIGLSCGLLIPGRNRSVPVAADRPALFSDAAVEEAVSVFAVDQHAAQTGSFSIAPSRNDQDRLETVSPEETSAGYMFSIRPIERVSATAKKILIYHSHTYEAYEQSGTPYAETEKWRTADEKCNMLRVGEELTLLLRGLGYQVVHDRTAFEPPDLSGAYTRSLDMLNARKENGETYDLYIDLHRDAYVEGQAGENVVVAGNVKTARLMLLIGKGEGYTNAGYEEKPDWEANLLLAQGVTDALNEQLDGLCKDVRLKSGRFNQHVAVGCMLVEVGNNHNTLEEALAAMPYLADAIHSVLSQ